MMTFYIDLNQIQVSHFSIAFNENLHVYIVAGRWNDAYPI